MGMSEGGGPPREARPSSSSSRAARAWELIHREAFWWLLSLAALPRAFPYHLLRLLCGPRAYLLLVRKMRSQPESWGRRWIVEYGFRNLRSNFSIARRILAQIALTPTGLPGPRFRALLREAARSARACPGTGNVSGPLLPRESEWGAPKVNPNPEIGEVAPFFEKHPRAWAALVELYLLDGGGSQLSTLSFKLDPTLLRMAARQPEAHRLPRLRRYFYQEAEWPLIYDYARSVPRERVDEFVSLLLDRVSREESMPVGHKQALRTLRRTLPQIPKKRLEGLKASTLERLLTIDDRETRRLSVRITGHCRQPSSPDHRRAHAGV